MNSRETVASQRHFLGHRISAGLVVVVLVAVFLAVPAFGQDGEDESPATVGPITGAQTMWSIANENRPDTRASIPQFMLAFVERNPDAFIAGNVNLLREGVILEVPTVEEALAISRAEATRRLDEQMEWFSGLSREEREALRDTAEGELPPVIEDPEPAMEPEEVAPEPEPAPDPERVEVVPEPEPTPETEVTIVDEVPEPDPLFDPEPTEPEEEVLPEVPDRMPDPIFEPDPDPRLDRPGDQPYDMPSPAVVDSDTPTLTEPAPPVAPGPGPEPGWMDQVSWWTWAGPALVLLLGLLLIMRIVGRRRDAEMLESELPTDTYAQANAGSSAAAAATPAGFVEPDEEDSRDAHEQDPEKSDDDDDSPWAQFEDAVVSSEPDVEEPTAVLEGSHPAEQSDDDQPEAPDHEQLSAEEPRKGEDNDELDLAALDDDEPEPASDLSDSEPEEERFDRLEAEEDDIDMSEFAVRPTDDQQDVDRRAVPEPDGIEEFDQPDEDEEDQEFDLTNFDFDETVVGGEDEDRTVPREDEPVDDDIDDSVPQRSGASLEDLDELMSRDLRDSGLLGGDDDEKRTEIAPPPEDGEDDPSEQPQEQAARESSAPPALNDQEAEVMIDLARLTADGGDEQYARDLLAEVIRDGSEAMAEEARKLLASLS